VVAIAADLDAPIASNTAATAIDNNLVVTEMLVLGMTGVAVGNAAYDVYDVYNKCEGDAQAKFEAAIKQLGVEAAVGAVGYAAGSIVFKLGGVVYPTAELAVNAAFNKTPGLKKALGNLGNKLLITAESFSQTKVGQGIAQAEAAAGKINSWISNCLKRSKNRAFKKFGFGSRGFAGRASIKQALLEMEQDIGINQTSTAILKNGYYEVNGVKFSEYYYNRLWDKGRKAPSLITKKILETADSIILDIEKPGFFKYETANHELIYNSVTKKYETANWELVYNPVTKEVWHLKQIDKKIKH